MNKIVRYITVFFSIGIIGFLLWYFSAIVIYILVSAVLSLIGHPVVVFLHKLKIWKIHIPKSICALVTLLSILAIFVVFFRIFIPIVANEANQISKLNTTEIRQNLHEPLELADNFAKKYNLFSDANLSIQDHITEKIVKVLSINNISTIFNRITGLLGNIFIAFFAISFITFFFLKDENMFYSIIFAITPTKYETELKNALESIKKLLMRYFIGITLDVLIVMTLITIGLSIVGLKLEHALIIALFVGIVNVIPYIGPIIGMIFGFLMAILTNLNLEFYTELLPMLGYMLIVFASVQILDATLIQPTIYSSSVRAHPLEIFLLIMIAGSVAGIAGMIVAIPSYTVIRVIAKEFFNQFKLVKKLTQNI